jgi:hypothetical protein
VCSERLKGVDGDDLGVVGDLGGGSLRNCCRVHCGGVDAADPSLSEADTAGAGTAFAGMTLVLVPGDVVIVDAPGGGKVLVADVEKEKLSVFQTSE